MLKTYIANMRNTGINGSIHSVHTSSQEDESSGHNALNIGNALIIILKIGP